MAKVTSEIPAYFRWLRRDVLARVPAGVQRVLSVGCASGVTEAELVKQGVEVVGIELDPAAAAVARQNGLIVIEKDGSLPLPELELKSFDCILYADVLEHFADPVRILRAHLRLLRDGGTVVVSVPNFRHYSVFLAIFLHGKAAYADGGIFDRTHLRITTRKLVDEWFQDVGLQSVSCDYIIYRRRNRLISMVTAGLLIEFIAKQVVLVGVK